MDKHQEWEYEHQQLHKYESTVAVLPIFFFWIGFIVHKLWVFVFKWFIPTGKSERERIFIQLSILEIPQMAWRRNTRSTWTSRITHETNNCLSKVISTSILSEKWDIKRSTTVTGPFYADNKWPLFYSHAVAQWRFCITYSWFLVLFYPEVKELSFHP